MKIGRILFLVIVFILGMYISKMIFNKEVETRTITVIDTVYCSPPTKIDTVFIDKTVTEYKTSTIHDTIFICIPAMQDIIPHATKRFDDCNISSIVDVSYSYRKKQFKIRNKIELKQKKIRNKSDWSITGLLYPYGGKSTGMGTGALVKYRHLSVGALATTDKTLGVLLGYDF